MNGKMDREMPENGVSNVASKLATEPVTRKLFNVTLDWEPGDDEQGDYATSVWARDEDEAIRLVAEEMADSGEVEHDSDDDRTAYIERVVDGAGQFAVEVVENVVGRDLANLLRDRPDALRAIRAILHGEPAVPMTLQQEARKLLPEAQSAKPLMLMPSGRFITDEQGRKVAEMFQPGDSPAEREAIKRRIVGSFNALPTVVGVLLRADKEGALWQALYNEGITDAYGDALSEAVKALGDEGIATVAHRYELDPEAVRSKVEGAEHVNSSAPHPSPGIEPSNP